MSTPRKRRITKRARRKLAMYALPVGATVHCRIFVNTDDPAQLPRNRWSDATVVDAGGLHTDDMTIVKGPDGRQHYKTLQRMWIGTGRGYKRVDQAATHLNRAGLWWWDQDGAPVRVATTLEVALFADGVVIGAGYTLATPENEEICWPAVDENAAVKIPKPEIVWRAPIDFCDPEHVIVEKKQAVKAEAQSHALEHARTMLAQAARKAKRWNTAQRKWARRVKALEVKQEKRGN